MFRNKKLVAGLVNKVRRAERFVLDQWHATEVEQEPAFTERLITEMGALFRGAEIGGLKWGAKTLTDRGPKSQEHEFGADLMSVFRVVSDGFNVAKGFLAQAKMIEPDERFSKKEFENLKSQCTKMLEHSSAAYVFLYSKKSGILVVPAVDVIGARECNPHELTSKDLGKFYGDHFECFLGDWTIKSADVNGLRELRRQRAARYAFMLVGYEKKEQYEAVERD